MSRRPTGRAEGPLPGGGRRKHAEELGDGLLEGRVHRGQRRLEVAVGQQAEVHASVVAEHSDGQPLIGRIQGDRRVRLEQPLPVEPEGLLGPGTLETTRLNARTPLIARASVEETSGGAQPLAPTIARRRAPRRSP